MLTPQDLADRFLRSQPSAILRVLDNSSTLRLEDVPTLSTIEYKIRQLKSGKAFGPDMIPTDLLRGAPAAAAKTLYSLILKSTVFGADPLQWRGGMVKPIRKKGNPKSAANWRNILISSMPGKIAHSIVRVSLNRAYQLRHDTSQYGGVKGASISVPTIALRTFQSFCRQKQISHAFLFVDGMEAFYRTIRELCISMPDLETLQSRLEKEGRHPNLIATILTHASEASAVHRHQVTPHLEAVLASMHQQTWFYVQGEAEFLCHTGMGSRPGDPVADILFNMLMKRVIENIRARLDEAGYSNRVLLSPEGYMPDHIRPTTPIEVPFDAQAWVDDLIYMVIADDPQTLLDDLASIISIVQHELLTMGITMNLQQGKSEALVSLHGKHSRIIKRRLHIDDAGMIIFNNQTGTSECLSSTDKYKYLGSLLTLRGGCLHDIRRRTSMVFQVLKTLRQPVFANPKTSMKAKRFVLHSLIMRKFMATSGSWFLSTPAEIRCFTTNVMRIYRYVFFAQRDIQKKEQYSHDYVIHYLGVLDPEELIHIHRIRAMISLVKTAPAYVWALLNKEGSWLSGLQDSLSWFNEYLFPLPNNKIHFIDLHTLIDWIATDIRGVKANLRRAQRAAMEFRHRIHAAREWTTSMCLHLPKAGFLRTQHMITDTQRHMEEGYMCGFCGEVFPIFRTAKLHARKKHDFRSDALRWARGTQCIACMFEFHTRNRLKRHFERGGHPCLQALMLHFEDPENLPEEGDKPDLHIPHYRIQGPITPWFDGVAQQQGPARTSIDQRPPPEKQESDKDPLSMEEWSWKEVNEIERPFFQDKIILHLFSGRRREGDFQWAVESLTTGSQFAYHVVSLDLAVDEVRGDLICRKTQLFWLDKMARGFISAWLAGPPCETFSRARFYKDGPPPLRSSRYPWGIRGITTRQHKQVMTANTLAQFVMELMLFSLIYRIKGVGEHPAPFTLPDSTCLWHLAMMKLLLQHPMATLHVIKQGMFGQQSAKPTGLVAIHAPAFAEDFHRHRLPEKDWQLGSIKMGFDPSTGGYHTAPLKEYPLQMNMGLAQVLTNEREQTVDSSLEIATFLENISEMICTDFVRETWLPDFNPCR